MTLTTQPFVDTNSLAQLLAFRKKFATSVRVTELCVELPHLVGAARSA